MAMILIGVIHACSPAGYNKFFPYGVLGIGPTNGRKLPLSPFQNQLK
jgi:hypothetical protein